MSENNCSIFMNNSYLSFNGGKPDTTVSRLPVTVILVGQCLKHVPSFPGIVVMLDPINSDC